MIAKRSEATQILEQLLWIKVQIHVVVVYGSVEQIRKLSVVHSLTVLGAAVMFGEGVEAA